MEEERKEQEQIYDQVEIKQNEITAHATLKLYLIAITSIYLIKGSIFDSNKSYEFLCFLYNLIL